MTGLLIGSLIGGLFAILYALHKAYRIGFKRGEDKGWAKRAMVEDSNWNEFLGEVYNIVDGDNDKSTRVRNAKAKWMFKKP